MTFFTRIQEPKWNDLVNIIENAHLILTLERGIEKIDLEGTSGGLPRLFKVPKKAFPFHLLIVLQKGFPSLCVNGVLIPTFIPLGQQKS